MAELMAILHGLRHDLYFSMEGHHRSKAQGQAGLYSMTMPSNNLCSGKSRIFCPSQALFVKPMKS
ncbi:hypothetical protein JHK87_016823 [Glycine soja]|nr:hypothetical protein JHK87_016823 [Glycine soja]